LLKRKSGVVPHPAGTVGRLPRVGGVTGGIRAYTPITGGIKQISWLTEEWSWRQVLAGKEVDETL